MAEATSSGPWWHVFIYGKLELISRLQMVRTRCAAMFQDACKQLLDIIIIRLDDGPQLTICTRNLNGDWPLIL